MRISDWSSDVCSSDLDRGRRRRAVRLSGGCANLGRGDRHAGLVPASNSPRAGALEACWTPEQVRGDGAGECLLFAVISESPDEAIRLEITLALADFGDAAGEFLEIAGLAEILVDAGEAAVRSEEHTPKLQSLMLTSYAVSCVKNKTR